VLATFPYKSYIFIKRVRKVNISDKLKGVGSMVRKLKKWRKLKNGE